jgi:hypothetical protein
VYLVYHHVFLNRMMAIAAPSLLLVWFRTCRGGSRPALDVPSPALRMALATYATLAHPPPLDLSMCMPAVFAQVCVLSIG